MIFESAEEDGKALTPVQWLTSVARPITMALARGRCTTGMVFVLPVPVSLEGDVRPHGQCNGGVSVKVLSGRLSTGAVGLMMMTCGGWCSLF